MDIDTYVTLLHIPYIYIIVGIVLLISWLVAEVKAKRRVIRIVASLLCIIYAGYFAWNAARGYPIAVISTYDFSLHSMHARLEEGKVAEVQEALREYVNNDDDILEAALALKDALPGPIPLSPSSASNTTDEKARSAD